MALTTPAIVAVQLLLTGPSSVARTLCVNRIWGRPGVPPEQIEYMPRKCVSVTMAPGVSDAYIPLHRGTVDIDCYGETSYEAQRVYLAVKEDLRRNLNNQVVVPGGTAYCYAIHEISPGTDMFDGDTNWARCFSSWRVQIYEDVY